MTVHEAIAEDLSKLGGPMGTEITTECSLGLFEHPVSAKQACERHYNKGKGHGGKPLDKWRRTDQGESAPDLGWVMYHVRKREVK